MTTTTFHADRIARIIAAADDMVVRSTDRQTRRINKRLRRLGSQALVGFTNDPAHIVIV